MEVSSNFEEGYFDSEGDVTFLDNLLSDDASHNLASEVISDHEPEQNEPVQLFFSMRDPLTPSANEISLPITGNVHAKSKSVIDLVPVSSVSLLSPFDD
ncbi:hypothetical protein Tco_1392724 [Tanacetum coccineum]